MTTKVITEPKPRVEAPKIRQTRMLIDGEWVDSLSGTTFTTPRSKDRMPALPISAPTLSVGTPPNRGVRQIRSVSTAMSGVAWSLGSVARDLSSARGGKRSRVAVN